MQEGLELIEIVFGIDLQKDIFDWMDFMLIMYYELKLMDVCIFIDELMNICLEMLEWLFDQCFFYDLVQDLFFVDFVGFLVCSEVDIVCIFEVVENKLVLIGYKVNVIVNYDCFFILFELVDDYIGVVKGIMDRYYYNVMCYILNIFLCFKFGEVLVKWEIVLNIYESVDEVEGILWKDFGL